jgi:hypothetical protein
MVKYLQDSCVLEKIVKKRTAGYVLGTSMVILSCICLVIVFQYHYYGRQRMIEQRLTTEMIQQTRNNLQAASDSSKRYLEFESDNR